ncbi:hypothetical protein L2E82_12661 [Cichorium intybus]|uniref:Uncharacterized protein n=1 Tax=Cichorium intybus TaxID=13427 RepID=A0ACB9GGG0_CICIN|nr:hypothetical protein L2E82_12661 [Cichorium intybus]
MFNRTHAKPLSPTTFDAIVKPPSVKMLVMVTVVNISILKECGVICKILLFVTLPIAVLIPSDCGSYSIAVLIPSDFCGSNFACRHILGVKVTYHDIEAIDPGYFKNLKWMLENDISDILDLTFSIDVDEEKLILCERTEANTEYSGYSAASPVIQWFWEVTQGFSKEDKARLLQFVTGTSTFWSGSGSNSMYFEESAPEKP